MALHVDEKEWRWLCLRTRRKQTLYTFSKCSCLRRFLPKYFTSYMKTQTRLPIHTLNPTINVTLQTDCIASTASWCGCRNCGTSPTGTFVTYIWVKLYICCSISTPHHATKYCAASFWKNSPESQCSVYVSEKCN